MFRKIATVCFAAVPATILCIPVALIGINGMGKLFGASSYPMEGIWGVAFSIFALLGTAGLWLVSIKESYKTILNFVLISCGVLVSSTILTWTLIEKPSWFSPISIGKDGLELAVFSSVFLFGIYYWVVISSSLFNKALKHWTG